MNSPIPTKGTQGGGMRAHFWRGLFVVIPVAVTVWLLNYAVSLCDNWLGPLVRMVADLLLPSTITSQPWFAGATAVLSLFLLVACLIVLGVVASYRMGKEGLRLIDHLFIHIPGVNSIYRTVRKMVDAFGNSEAQSFKRCVYLLLSGEQSHLGFVTKGNSRGRHQPQNACGLHSAGAQSNRRVRPDRRRRRYLGCGHFAGRRLQDDHVGGRTCSRQDASLESSPVSFARNAWSFRRR